MKKWFMVFTLKNYGLTTSNLYFQMKPDVKPFNESESTPEKQMCVQGK